MLRNLIPAARVSSPLNVCVGSCESIVTAATSYLVMQVYVVLRTPCVGKYGLCRGCVYVQCKSQAWVVCRSWVSVGM